MHDGCAQKWMADPFCLCCNVLNFRKLELPISRQSIPHAHYGFPTDTADAEDLHRNLRRILRTLTLLTY